MTEKKKFPLGQLLVDKGYISPEQLTIALRRQQETGEMLGITLMELGYIDEEAIFLPLLAGQMGVEYITLKEMRIPAEAINKIPAKFAIHYKIIPVDFKDDVLTIASIKPLDVHTCDELGVVVKERIHANLSSEKDILEAIRQYYGVGAETIEQMMDDVPPAEQLQEGIDVIDDLDSEASISKFLNQIFLEAYRDRATDIHIEPFEDSLQIRYRIDGILYDAKVPSTIVHFKDSIISRIKILASLDIAEKRVPQDGRFKVRMKDIDLDLRVSFLPTPYGESCVLRILNTTRLYKLQELGLTPEELRITQSMIAKPHGIVFLTGPTGSGKTTTLYSCLTCVNTEENKIITIEDPIEYQLKGITQIQINPPVGLTFAAGLRSMLRHDPDIMMVGEVRDKETADIAIQVALTGHLIFSTLHTNDAAGGAARLLDMGVDPYLITSTVECFIAQRLIRVLCGKCKIPVKATLEMVRDFGEIKLSAEQIIYEGKGCESCNQTGYMGRTSIYEFLIMNNAIRELIMQRAAGNKIKDEAVKHGMKTLRLAGWEKIKNGLTSIAEVIRVTQEEGT